MDIKDIIYRMQFLEQQLDKLRDQIADQQAEIDRIKWANVRFGPLPVVLECFKGKSRGNMLKPKQEK